MTSDQVRTAVSGDPFIFRKTPDSGEVYAYQGNAFQVFFSTAQSVEFIELSRSEHFSVSYQGIDLLGTPAKQVIEQMAQWATYDRDAPGQGYTYTFPTLELAFWRPVRPGRYTMGDGRYFSTVGIGRPGYYSAG